MVHAYAGSPGPLLYLVAAGARLHEHAADAERSHVVDNAWPQLRAVPGAKKRKDMKGSEPAKNVRARLQQNWQFSALMSNCGTASALSEIPAQVVAQGPMFKLHDRSEARNRTLCAWEQRTRALHRDSAVAI